MEPAAATAALEGRYAVLRASAAGLGSEELLEVIEVAQREKDAASARQAVALAHLSAREPHLQEDGTTVEVHHGLGHQRMDAPDLAASRMGVSVHVATRRVTQAIDQLARTPAVVDAMASGDLDEQRAAVVTEETEFLSAESAAAVVGLVAQRWAGLTTGPLRRVLARTAAQVDPEAVAAHAQDERERRGLTRRLGAHGTDHWRGDFHVEQSRVAWAAVTERARQRVREGLADTLEKARADAMMELILEHSDVRVVVHTTRAATDHEPTVDETTTSATSDTDNDANSDSAAPATPPGTSRSADGLIEVGGLGAPGTTFVPRAWVDAALTAGADATPATSNRTSASVDTGNSPIADQRASRDRELVCDPTTGALLSGDVPTSLASSRTRRVSRTSGGTTGQNECDAYRVPGAMARLVRLRDGCCRFPGCSTPARHCDLDHVRPWPTGPTHPGNLIALCRRHHRIKQRPGWTLHLHPDGRVTWHDPTGTEHTTWAVDHLHLTTPNSGATGTASAAPTSPDLELPTTFEDELHDLLEQHAAPPRHTHPRGWDARGQLIGGPPPRTDHHTGRLHHPATTRHHLVILDLPPRPPKPIPF